VLGQSNGGWWRMDNVFEEIVQCSCHGNPYRWLGEIYGCLRPFYKLYGNWWLSLYSCILLVSYWCTLSNRSFKYISIVRKAMSPDAVNLLFFRWTEIYDFSLFARLVYIILTDLNSYTWFVECITFFYFLLDLLGLWVIWLHWG